MSLLNLTINPSLLERAVIALERLANHFDLAGRSTSSLRDESAVGYISDLDIVLAEQRRAEYLAKTGVSLEEHEEPPGPRDPSTGAEWKTQ